MKLRVQSGDQLNLGGYDFCFSLNLLTILSLILDLIPLVGIPLAKSTNGAFLNNFFQPLL